MKTSPSHRCSYAILLLIILFSAAVRFRLRDFPLERDEGEYAYAGQLILQSIPPYQLAYNMKLPGTYAAYALLMGVFGQTASGIHIGVLFINAATIILVYFLAVRFSGWPSGIVAAASYSLLSMNQTILGMAGHAEHFVLLPALAGILVLLKAVELRRKDLLFWSGVLLGLSFLMKQPAIAFVLFGGIYLVVLERQEIEWRRLWTRVGIYSSGAVLPFLLTCLIVLKAGVFGKFWFWTFSYAAQYASSVNFDAALQLFRFGFVRAVGDGLLIWMIAAAGLVLLFVNRARRERAVFVGGFFLFSFIAVCPGFHFREHYFILMLPAVSLLSGIAVTTVTKMLLKDGITFLRFVPALCFIVACSLQIVRQRDFLFRMDPLTASRSVYGENPFPEAVEIGDYIKAHSTPADRVAVLGSEPEIYFYSQRHSATGHIYMYGLMEPQKYALQMQEEMIREVESAKPKYVVYADVSVSWLAWPNSQRLVFDWAKNFLHEHYEIVGVADILAQPKYRWGEDARSSQRRSPLGVYIFERNGR